jgi:hypothetical protein
MICGKGVSMEWAEPLPEFCPPNDSRHPSNEYFYRLIESDEPTLNDFHSHRHLWPDRKFQTDECRARSVSIFNALEECKKVCRLPIHRNKKVVELNLTEDSGLIKQTGRNISHYSWWRYKEFNPLNHCKILMV